MTSIIPISRKKLKVIELYFDYCDNTFGSAPCTAEGERCYNTYKTCSVQTNFTLTEKIYRFISLTAGSENIRKYNARPYLVKVANQPTQIREDRTVPSRSTITLLDERDDDLTTDPYWSTRGHASRESVPGTYWKKFFARNPYYRGRKIRVLEGYEGQELSEFTVTFTGEFEKYGQEDNKIKITAVDALQGILKTKFPIEVDLTLTNDMPAFTICNSEEEMLSLDNPTVDDLVLRKDFVIMDNYPAYGEGSLLSLTVYYYRIVAYDVNDNPIAASSTLSEQISDPAASSIILNWTAVTGAEYYRVYGRTAYADSYAIVTGTQFQDYGGSHFNNLGEQPSAAYRIYKLTGDNPTDVNSWSVSYDTFSQQLTGTSFSKLGIKGYLKIEDEAVYYEYTEGDTIVNLKRAEYDTESVRHFAGTKVKLCLWLGPDNAYSQLTKILAMTRLASESIDTDAIATERDRWSAAEHTMSISIDPVIDEITLDKLLADWGRITDTKYWVNEQGKLTVKHNSVTTTAGSIDDRNNIIRNSTKVDVAVDTRKTRIEIFWGRKSIDKNNEYIHVHRSINTDAEDVKEHGDEQVYEIQTLFINSDSDGPLTRTDYLDALGLELLQRYYFPPPEITFETDVKDMFNVGDTVLVDTDEFNYADGSDWNNEPFQIIYKDSGDVKIKYKAIFRTAISLTVSHEEDDLYKDEIPQAILKETEYAGIEVENLEIISGIDPITGYINADVTLQWGNEYLRTNKMVMKNTGQYQKMFLSPYHQTHYYRVYIIKLNRGETAPDNKVPSNPLVPETKGTWLQVTQVVDEHSLDPDKKYTFTIEGLKLGARYCFAVYAFPRQRGLFFPQTTYSYPEDYVHGGYIEGKFVNTAPVTEYEENVEGLINGQGYFDKARLAYDAEGREYVQYGSEMDFIIVRDKMVDTQTETAGVSATGGIQVIGTNITIQSVGKL